jgi:non-heme chloroperoxidase
MAALNEHEAKQIAQANESGWPPVVFVHGLRLFPSSWDCRATVFEEAGNAAGSPPGVTTTTAP